MTTLIGNDGKHYDIPEDKVDTALASGAFKFLDNSAQNVPIPKNPNVPLDETIDDSSYFTHPEKKKFIDHSAQNLPIPKDPNLPIDEVDDSNERTQDKFATQSKLIDHSAQNVPLEKDPQPVNTNREPTLDLVNKETGATEHVPESNANQLVASGSHTVSDVPLIDKDGKLYQFPDDKIQDALQTGQFRLSTQKERQQYLGEKAEQSDIEEGGGTGLKPYIGGSADAFLTGINEHNPVAGIGNAILGDKNVLHEQEKIAEAVKKANPVAYYTGATTGEVGSALGLGGVASGVSKGLGLSGAARIATEGAVYSAEPVTQAIVNKDPAGAAEALALGVGMNFGIHGVFSALGAIPKAVNGATEGAAKKLATSIDQEQAENIIGKQVLGLSPAKIAELRDKIAPALKAAGITSEDVISGKAMEKIQKLETSGPAIGKAIDELDRLLPSEKKPIIKTHLSKAEEELQKLFPPEVQQQLSLRARIARLSHVLENENPELNDELRKGFEDYQKKMESYQEYLAKPKPEAPPNFTDNLNDQQATKAEGKASEPTASVRPEGTGTWGNERPTKGAPEPEAPVSPKEAWTEEKQKAWDEYQNRTPRSKPNLIFSPRAAKFIEEQARYGQAGKDLDSALKQLANLSELPPSAIQAKKALDPLIKELKNTSKRGTFDATQKLKQFIREQTNFTDNGYANRLRKQAYHVVAEHLMNAEDAAAQLEGVDTSVTQGLREQRAAYTFHKLFGDAADRLASKQLPESIMQQVAGMHRHERSLPIMMLHMLGIPNIISIPAGLGLPFAKKYLAKQTLGRAAKKLLGESTVPETDTIMHALHMQEVKINEDVKNTLSALSASKTSEVIAHKPSLNEFLPDNGSGKSHKNQLQILRSAIDDNVANPDKLATHLGDITASMRHEGMGQVAEEYTQHQIRLMKVIDTIIPKDNSMDKAHPFSAQVDINEISPAAKEKYQRALSIAADPTHLLQMIKDNSITPGDVAIAAATNPATLDKMRKAMVNEAIKSKPDLSYQQRLSVGILMGTNIDASTDQVPLLQSVYGASSGVPASTGAPKKGKAVKAMNFSENALTVSQKAAGHHS